jgi:hypothetical protein
MEKVEYESDNDGALTLALQKHVANKYRTR